mmetsp:Transcript_16051/g.35681  ORF Transcript_16051/g.35681 Transcript_16051/m.35681 type:complete len:130 (+) Transcript_16051:55-444(+)
MLLRRAAVRLPRSVYPLASGLRSFCAAPAPQRSEAEAEAEVERRLADHYSTRIWRVRRSTNGSLPVYLKVQRHGTKFTTVVRHLEGDQEAFKKEIMNVCESQARCRIGTVEVAGQHVWKVKEWLRSIGF